MRNRLLANALLILGISLLLLTVYGRLIYAPPLSQYANQDFPRQSQLATLNKADRHEPLAYTMAVTDYFHQALKHAWKPETQRSNLIAISYNWSFVLGRIFYFWKHQGLGFSLNYINMPMEYYQVEPIIARGIGYCSQKALAIRDYMQRRGYDSEVIGLNGHVINQTRFENRGLMIMDADYNVVLPFSISYAKTHPAAVRHYYQKALNKRDITKVLFDETLTMYLKADYQSTAPMQHVFELCLIFNWLAPIGLILLGLLLGRMKFMKQKRNIFI